MKFSEMSLKKNYFITPSLVFSVPVIFNLIAYLRLPSLLPAIIIPLSGEIAVWAPKTILYVLKSPILAIVLSLMVYFFFRSINKLLILKAKIKLSNTKGIYYYYVLQLLVFIKVFSYSIIFLNIETDTKELTGFGHFALLCSNFATIFIVVYFLKVISHYKHTYRLNVLASKKENTIQLFSYTTVFNFSNRKAIYFIGLILFYIAVSFLVK